MDHNSPSSIWFDAYREHLVERLAPPTSEHGYKHRDIKFPFGMMIYHTDSGSLFCTCGLSMYPQQLGSVLEVFCPVIGSDLSEVEKILAANLLDVLHIPLRITAGFVIPGLEQTFPGFFARYDKSAIYFSTLQPSYEELDNVYLSNAKGNFYQATFISPAELLYLQSNGSERFEELFEEHEVVSIDLARPSVA